MFEKGRDKGLFDCLISIQEWQAQAGLWTCRETKGTLPLKQKGTLPLKQKGTLPLKQKGTLPLKQKGTLLLK